MLLTRPFKNNLAQDNYTSLNGSSSLARGLVFAYSGHSNVDLIGGTRGVPTNSTEVTALNKRGWNFIGGGTGNSQIGFGNYLPTSDLGETPATFAFLAIPTDNTSIALVAQNDGNGSQGFLIGMGRTNTVLGCQFTRSNTNVRKSISEALPPNGQPFTMVVTYDGGQLAAGVNVYLNGVLGTPTDTADGSGTSSAASTHPLLLGGRGNGYNIGISNNGVILVALLANRVWSSSEVGAFHRNPYEAFQRPLNMVMSFSSQGPSLISGIANIVFNATANAGNASNISGSSSITFGQSGNLINTGLIGSSSIVFNQSGNLVNTALSGSASITFNTSASISHQGHVGNFDYIPCDDCAASSTPQVLNINPPANTLLQPNSSVEFDVIDTGAAFKRIIVYAKYPNTNIVEILHTGDKFCPLYINSSRVSINNGYHYKIVRSIPWPDVLIDMTIDAIDVSGSED